MTTRADTEEEVKSAVFVFSFMKARGVEVLRVDDENKTPCYALDYDDEELDHAIAWLPRGGRIITNPTEPAWNPVVRIEDLERYLKGPNA